jgi:hypothetical protein
LTEEKIIEQEGSRMLPIHHVIERITRRLARIPLGRPEFSDPRYKPFDFNLDYFHPLGRFDNDCLLSFVDGGNTSIFTAPNLSVQLVRVYFNLFKGAKRINPKILPQRIEFYAICYAVEDNGHIFYETDLVPVKDEWVDFIPDANDLKFNSFDRTLMLGPMRAPIYRVAETARQFAEWKLLGLVVDTELEAGDIIVRDGTLQTVVTKERIYANSAVSKAITKGINLLSLSKTSTLFTSTGYSLIAAIAELAEKTPHAKSSWYYNPTVTITHPDHQAEMYFVKLYPQSDYVFRLEFLKSQAEKMGQAETLKIMGLLSANSEDATFPGYPYGLLDADRFAQVTSSEAQGQEIQFLSCATDRGAMERLQRCLRASNAHDVINKFGG